VPGDLGIDITPQDATQALAALPSGLFVMTSAHDAKRSGTLVRWAMQCAAEPPLIAVAIYRGHWVEPLIRDSHAFGLCRVDPADKLIHKKFGDLSRRDGDPFDCLPVESILTGAPIIKRSYVAFDCLVIRHFDLEADHSLYIGHVVGGRIYQSERGSKSPADTDPGTC
jgi:flavin reductase (DIM6/NTAB) family NADH-FMN oxidoreductase RutF